MSVGIYAGACSSNTGGDSSAASTGQQPAGSNAQNTSTAYKPKGTLPKPMDDITPAEFAAFVDGLNWTGHYHDRDCEGPGCTGAVKAKVLLEAVDDAHKVDIKALPATGALMARMLNVGTVKEGRYHLPTDGGEWYFLYYPTTAGPKFDLVRLRFDAQGVPNLMHKVVAVAVDVCGPPDDHKPQARASAGFTQCDPRPANVTPLVLAPSKNVWISCSVGCCSSGYPTWATAADSVAHPFVPDPD